MNRDIRFRAWDREEKKMYIAEDWLMISGDGDCYVWNMGKRLREKDFILMQFTGLKDKDGKGKDVYQADLIRSCPKGYEPREIYEVVWDEERLEWGVKSKIGMITSLWTFDKDFEVIGNVMENPELKVAEDN